MIKKILIVNRGEIAVRIIRACRELKIISAVIYSEADINSLHVKMADESYLIGLAPSSESYLNVSKILEIAKRIKADAIHPGYGFLAENSSFIKKCEKFKIIFIGPSSKSVELMGDKTRARSLMLKNNVPITPGATTPIVSASDAAKVCKKIGYPVMLKASAGGGGKGMRVVNRESELSSALASARNEAKKAFGNDEVYIEKLIVNPKHIEVQILGDKHGNYVHLFERECSIQRRHQKIIEESPSPSIDESLREQLTTAAINAAKACGYYNAGTIEFLMDQNSEFYFMEMNTRLQVEHPVTEMITGVDLVKEQIRIADGMEISFRQSEIKIHGHAIECRVCAEDGSADFAPSTGTVTHHRIPSGPGVRVDSGIDTKSEVGVYYDSLLSKVITHAANRKEAIERMKRALIEYQIGGLTTNIPVCNFVLNHKSFVNGSFTINFIDEEFHKFGKQNSTDKFVSVAAILAALLKDEEKQNKVAKNKVSSQNNWSLDEN